MPLPTSPICAYECCYHRGKIEWHHPVSEKPAIGLYLCEAHHSLLQGRKKRYLGECQINKTLEQIRAEVVALQNSVLVAAGLGAGYVNKH